MLTFACVCVGKKYPVEYVEKLRNMIRRHKPGTIRYRIICLTDQSYQVEGVEMIEVDGRLPGWWTKMLLFNPELRGRGQCVYLDLDTVIIDTLRPLAELETRFAICANFTRRAGHFTWPCSYGSCVMSFAEGFGGDIYRSFMRSRHLMMEASGKYGDQFAIEHMVPGAMLLQDVLPDGYFVGRRELTDQVPTGASLVILAGNETPANSKHPWIKDYWQ